MLALNLLSITDISNGIVNTLSTSLGVWYVILVNAFGVISIILKVTEFQCKSRKYIFFFATSSTFCWVFYFALQGDFVSALINLVCAIQMFVFMQRGKYKWADSIWWMIGFLLVQLAFSVATFKIWSDIFALLGGLLVTVVYFVVNQKAYRALAFISLILWIFNGVFKGYVIALINDSFGAISALVGIIRFDILGKNKNKTLPIKEDAKGIE